MQVHYKTEKGNLIFVKVPYDANLFEVNVIGDCFCYSLNGMPETLDLIGCNWQLIGLTTEIAEEKAKIVVSALWNGYMNYELKNKPVGNYNRYVKVTALESFKSIMQFKEVYEETELKKYPKYKYRTGKWIVLFKPN